MSIGIWGFGLQSVLFASPPLIQQERRAELFPTFFSNAEKPGTPPPPDPELDCGDVTPMLAHFPLASPAIQAGVLSLLGFLLVRRLNKFAPVMAPLGLALGAGFLLLSFSQRHHFLQI